MEPITTVVPAVMKISWIVSSVYEQWPNSQQDVPTLATTHGGTTLSMHTPDSLSDFSQVPTCWKAVNLQFICVPIVFNKSLQDFVCSYLHMTSELHSVDIFGYQMHVWLEYLLSNTSQFTVFKHIF